MELNVQPPEEVSVSLEFQQRVTFEFLLLDEIVFQAGCCMEDRPVVDRAFSHDHVTPLPIRALNHVFDVQKREPLGESVEILNRTVTADDHPSAIHLKDNSVRVGTLE